MKLHSIPSEMQAHASHGMQVYASRRSTKAGRKGHAERRNLWKSENQKNGNERKVKLYREAGAREYRIVDAETVTVYDFEHGAKRNGYGTAHALTD